LPFNFERESSREHGFRHFQKTFGSLPPGISRADGDIKNLKGVDQARHIGLLP
jgi:hypothetical protein